MLFRQGEHMMSKLIELKKHLVCPHDQTELKFSEDFYSDKGVPFCDGEIKCIQGHKFRIEGGIPRFAPRSSYSAAFGLQWQRFRRTQLDSYTGQPYSRQRLEGCLKIPLENLTGKSVLEVGSGAGRFTELLINKCDTLVSLDMSEAVDANLQNCSALGPYFLCQADITQSPLPRRYFDIVICIGVIQHTPSPELTMAKLAEHVKPGGLLIIDHYTLKRGYTGTRLGRILSLEYPLREILKRVNPTLGLKATNAIMAISYPVRKHTCKISWLDRFVGRLLPCACHDNAFPLLAPNIIYEWNELDTHDRLTAYYVHFRSPQQIRACLEQQGLQVSDCDYGGNGVEARAVLPIDR